MSAMFDCDLEFQEEKEFYPESEDDDLEVSSVSAQCCFEFRS